MGVITIREATDMGFPVCEKCRKLVEEKDIELNCSKAILKIYPLDWQFFSEGSEDHYHATISLVVGGKANKIKLCEAVYHE